MGTSALRITAPFWSNRLSQKSAKKPEKLGCAGVSRSFSNLTHARKKVKFLLHRKVCKRPASTGTLFQSTPLRKGRQHRQQRFLNISFSIHAPIRGATSGDYLVNSRTAAVNPTAKACFCQSSHSCNRASRASSLTTDVRASTCLCRASGSNKSGSHLHSPSYRASNSGFMFPP